ncbi:unnamed protein product [Musa banksii]
MRAVMGLKEQAVKSIKDTAGGVTSGSHRARRLSGGLDSSSHDFKPAEVTRGEGKVKRAEESLRTVMMKFGNKACVAVTLGAAIELKDQVAKPYSSAIKGNLSTIGSSTAEVGRFHSTPESPTSEFRPHDKKHLAGEESLRTVMYLSCWGPS